MEQEPKEHPTIKLPRYDRARRCFTRTVPSLVECMLKRMPKVLIPNLKVLTGETLDSHESAIQKTLSKVPAELREPISFNFMLHAAKHNYKMIFYKRRKTKKALSKICLKDDKKLNIYGSMNQSAKEDTLICDDIILDHDTNPSGNTMALSLTNGAVQFFQKKDTVWEDIGATPPENNKTVFHVTRFFDDTTCVSYSINIRNELTLYTLNNASLQSSKIPLESSIYLTNPNKKNILFFIDPAWNLFCCLKNQSGIQVQKVTSLSSRDEFDSVVSENKFFNYVVNDFSENPILHVIGLIDTQLQAIKQIKACNIFSIANKVYVKSFKKGIIHLAKAIDDNHSFDEKTFEHHAIDVNAESSIATFHGKFYVKPMLNLPYQAILALIALENSDDPSQLAAWATSSVVKNLSEELKNQLMEEHDKKKSS